MRIVVTGSIATDHLMVFPGKFTEQLVDGQLEHISLSFLVEELDIRRGGCAGNIAFGLGVLGLRPILVGAVGGDFHDYRSWLDRHGVDTESIHVSDTRHTARFLCTTDQAQNQIASFYTGAMAEAREIELRPIAERVGGLDLVLISPNDPEAMLRHTEECRQRGYPFAADPSQQLATMDSDAIRSLVDGAEYLFTNEYEHQLLLKNTRWSDSEVLNRVGTWVTTLGERGVRIERRGEPALTVPTPPEQRRADPTGIGDGFRAGFLWGLGKQLDVEQAARFGCLLATIVLENVGGQEYRLARTSVLGRFARTYGSDAADEIAEVLPK